MKAREPGRLAKGEHALHLAIVEMQLGAFRDLVTALAGRYPTREPPLNGVVEVALWRLFNTLRLIERRRSKLRS